jgi:penicillin-binding protein 1A
MDSILVKIFATALALSEVLTQPQAVKTKFDPVTDQAQVVQILRNGCTYMRHAFDIESINLDDLISTALDDPKAVGANAEVFHGINFADLKTAYQQFCKNEPIDKPVVDLGQVVDYFNNAAAELPDQSALDALKGKKLPSMTTVLDGKGDKFADIYQPGNRRIWVPLSDIPDFVQKAFIAAEDQRFYQHHGIDEHGIIRAFIGNLANPGRPEGGSTITQQVVKNLLVGDSVTYERKIREMITASRLENTLNKGEILQLYLNSVYMGRGSWGIEAAARSYFGKSVKDLTLPEAAMIAALLKGPSYYNPDKHPHRAQERLTYVLDRMKDDGFITAAQRQQALASPPKLIAFKRLQRDSGFEFVDYLGHEAKADGIDSLTAEPYTLHSTINAQLQQQTEADLQEGLAEYEIANGRMEFHGPEANLAEAVQAINSARASAKPTNAPVTDASATNTPATNTSATSKPASTPPATSTAITNAPATNTSATNKPASTPSTTSTALANTPGSKAPTANAATDTPAASMPSWQQALLAVHLPLYDVHWTPAVVVDKGGGRRRNGVIHVGLPDGRVVPLTTYTYAIRRELNLYDVIYVNVVGGNTPAAESGRRVRPLPVHAEIRVRPTVQGAALVLENKTGRILAMTGSFSYPLSQLNRTWQTERQPGSAVKPITYLTALQKGLQPNTLILDDPITLPPIGSGESSDSSIAMGDSDREQDYWSPHNYGYEIGGVYTLRRGLENSVNIVTAHLLDGAIDTNPEQSLDDICATAVAAKIYSNCVRYYPFVLGAQPVRMIDLAAFYAATANEGIRPQPHGIDSIQLDGKTIYQYPETPVFPMIGAADRASFYQLKSMLQGVVARGTARAIASLSPYVAGKTGTTEDSVDGWFIGFTNDVTVAVWIGYDNGHGTKRSLGGVDGARVALPIFKPIIEDVWADKIAPKVPLAGPSPQAQAQLVDLPIDYMSGTPIRGGRGAFIEHFRVGPDGHVVDTQNLLVSREEAEEYQQQGTQYSEQDSDGYYGSDGEYGGYGDGGPGYGGRSYYPNRGWQGPPQPQQRGLFSNWNNDNWGNPNYQRPRPLPPPPPPPQPTARGFFTPWGQ